MNCGVVRSRWKDVLRAAQLHHCSPAHKISKLVPPREFGRFLYFLGAPDQLGKPAKGLPVPELATVADVIIRFVSQVHNSLASVSSS